MCALTESGQGGGKLFVNVDPDGLGPAGFGDRVFAAATHVGGFDFIPPQPDRSVDAEPGLAWDRTGGPHNGRVYLVYTKEQQNESDNTDIYVRYSDDDGATWSGGVRVNDDHTVNSQFLPKISLDPTTGNLAVVWYDSRADLGTGGPGDTDGVANDDAQFWGAFSTDGGQSFTPNIQISAGTSNAHDSGNGIDYGDYSGLSFVGGVAHPAWSDNSNSTGNQPGRRTPPTRHLHRRGTHELTSGGTDTQSTVPAARRPFPHADGRTRWSSRVRPVRHTEPWFITGSPPGSCSDDADAVFVSIDHLRPLSVRPRPSLRKLFAHSDPRLLGERAGRSTAGTSGRTRLRRDGPMDVGDVHAGPGYPRAGGQASRSNLQSAHRHVSSHVKA